MVNIANYGLGRREQFDDESRNFQIRTLLAAEQIIVPRSYTWSYAPILNQGSTGTCVGHAGAAELGARPVKWPSNSKLAFLLYELACRRDIWVQNDNGDINFGTSVLALMKAMQEIGFIAEYRWAGAGSGKALEDLVLTIGYKGPAVLGSIWYNSMFTPESDGHIPCFPASGEAGGHAYLINKVAIKWKNNIKPANPTFADVDLDNTKIWMVNSWGNWGYQGKGIGYFTLNDIQLLLDKAGEAAIPIVRTRTS